MMPKSWVNRVLYVAVLVAVALCWAVPERDVRRPNYEFLPETQMALSPAYDSFAPNPNFADGTTLRVPPADTIPRGQLPLHYQPTPQDAVRAGQELPNPFKSDDASRLARGAAVFTNYCQVCHGPLGLGNGPITRGGFPPPASLLADRAVQMKDGQMFHVLTYGQGNMPSFSVAPSAKLGFGAAALSIEDRWSVILHIRLLQRPYAPGPAATRSEEVARVFRQNCAACHGEDGTGATVRKILPLIPDFTSLAWQMSQTELAIVNQIDYGTQPLMPAFRYLLPQEQILGLAVYIRSFAAHQPVGQPMVPPTANLTADSLYGSFCYACHDTNGKGTPATRKMMPEVPDFTTAAWQKSRTDADLNHSILEGKGKFMLPMKDKLGSVDAKKMVALVRGFNGGKQIIPIFKELPPAIPDSQRKIFEDAAAAMGLHSQGAKALPLLGATTVGLMASPSGPRPLLGASVLIPGTIGTGASSGETGKQIRIGANIFQSYCMVCHGPDGTGSLMRPGMPTIPNFTSETFHKEHSNAQIAVSILDGKGTFMPANRGRVTEEQAGYLVAYIRAFGPPAYAVQDKNRSSDPDFEDKYKQLEQQWKELQKELDKIKPPK